MNNLWDKRVVVWSAGLVAVGFLGLLFPFPGPLVTAALAAAGWILLVTKGVVVPAPAVAAPVLEAEAVEQRPPEVVEVVSPALVDELERFRARVEVIVGLKGLVVTDTEAAVLRLTNALFTLVANSKDVSAHIERSLAFLTDGDSGLKKTVNNLEEQVAVFETLASHFKEVKESLSNDIGSLTQTVGNINQFSETLSDLADQTNVLAINASIEAARVGIHGRGFAVIATQVQALARNSKEISEKMARTVQEVVSNVESSFGRQVNRIHEADQLIVHSEQELRRWADHVGPQMAEIGAMVEDSRRLAGVVTGELNDVTVSLQFQDRTRQVLDHLEQVAAQASEALVAASGLGSREVSAARRDEAFQAAARLFTVKEEWAAVPTLRPSPSGSKSVEVF
jgi:uncharacterized phage infection (PIP) family protein YhgE